MARLNKKSRYAMKFGEELQSFLGGLMENVPKNDRGVARQTITEILAVALINDFMENEYQPMEGVLLLTGIWKELVLANINPDDVLRATETMGGIQ